MASTKGIFLFIAITGCFSLPTENVKDNPLRDLVLDPEFQVKHPVSTIEKARSFLNDADPHIVGGIESVPNSRPYQVGLFIPVGNGRSFCGGSLINARTVLTAAHCVAGRNGNVSVILGAHHMEPLANETFLNISSGDIIVHAGYNSQVLLHDIAIIRFDEPVPLSNTINTVLLPRADSGDYLGNVSLVSGWGRPSDQSNTISNVLREVQNVVISNYACRMAYFGLIEDSHICTTGAYGRGTCNGDSGGPLVVNGIQVGVVSFVSSWGCESGWPPGFARVTYYLDWISQNSAPAN